MLRPVQLADLAATLSRHGYAASTRQTLAAAKLMATLPERIGMEELAPWLAPIFCSSAEQQKAFTGIYLAWLHAQRVDPVEPEVGVTEPTYEPGPSPSAFDSAIAALGTWDRGWTAALLLLPLIVATIALVLSGPPVQSTHTNSPPQRPTATAQPTPEQLRPPELQPSLQARFAEPPAVTKRATPNRSSGGIRSALISSIAVLCLFLCWLIQLLRRRGVLERHPRDEQQSELELRAGRRPVLGCLREEIAQLGRTLRRRTTVPSRELDVAATVGAYCRRGAVLDLVFGRRSEPEYLVLVDRASRHDHMAKIADEMVRLLHDRSGVIIDQYMFNGDPRRLRQQSLRDERRLSAEIYSLEGLLARHPQARMLILSDGKGLIDPLLGRPAAWLPVLLQWPEAVLVTPRPADSWSVREWMLSRSGLKVVAMDSDGLASLGQAMTASYAAPDAATDAFRRGTPAYLRDVSGLLDSVTPGQGQREQLLNALWADLGVRGFIWLCACAAYPEIHWGITVAMGRAMMPESDKYELDREHTQILIKLSVLPWLRHGFMPDWLRESLLSSLDRRESAIIRTALSAYLERVAIGGAENADDNLTILHAGAEGFWRDVMRGCAALLHGREQRTILEDGVYLRFMSGRPPRLSVSAGERIARFFYQHGSALARPRKAPYLAALAIVGIAQLFVGGQMAPYLQRTLEYPAPRALAFDFDGSALMMADELGRIRVGGAADVERAGETIAIAKQISADDKLDFTLNGQMNLIYFPPVLRFFSRTADGREVARGWSFRGGYQAPDITPFERDPEYMGEPIALQADSFGKAAEGELQIEALQRLASKDSGLCSAFSSKTKQLIVIGKELLQAQFGSSSRIPTGCAVSMTSQSLAVITSSEIFVYSLLASNGKQRTHIVLPLNKAFSNIAVSDDGLVVSAISDGQVYYWRNQKLLILQVQPAAVGPLVLSNFGEHVAVADTLRRTQLWLVRQTEPPLSTPSDAAVTAAAVLAAAAAADAAAAASTSASTPVLETPRTASKKNAATGSGTGAVSSPAPVPEPQTQQSAIKENFAELDYQAAATSTPTGRSGSMGPEYEFKFHLNEPAEKLAAIQRVVYRMDDPSFKQKEYVSSDATSGFVQSYRGWGCLPNAQVTIYFRDRTTKVMRWNMCASLEKQPAAAE